ncbi:VPLPA-CTERM sorting domain-containing protein [Litoreibacter meonggei]|nr:VPLPA-CTERM sorting domain-containing protein [Litoreibacter meonggei]
MKSLGILIVAALLPVGAVQASQVQVFNDVAASSGGPNGIRGTVNCSAACSVLTNAGGSFGFGDPGELFEFPFNGNNPSNELTWMNSVLNTSYGLGDSSKVDSTSSGVNYVTSFLYVILKIGQSPSHTILRNDSGGALTFSYDKASGAQGGLSHYVQVGQIPTVPLPAGGMLLLSALGAFGLAKKRRR